MDQVDDTIVASKKKSVRIANNAEIKKTVKTNDKPLTRSRTLAGKQGPPLEISIEESPDSSSRRQ